MESSPPGLYVHVPFCQSKCPYCDFYSITSPELVNSYLEAVNREALIYKGSFPSFDTLYLGGGTPSLLSGAQLEALTKTLHRHFHFAPNTEFTLEANPDDITAEKLHIFRDLGLNRLSLGVQSFTEAELVFLQRRHNARQTRQAIELIRAAGFANLGLDLMYGLSGQTPDAWLKTLETALSFTPEHLSCYQLTIAAETPLAHRLARGELTLPDEEAQRDFFLLTRQFLQDRGYIHYEISNFARGEEYLSRHNRKYWDHTPYLGLGPAAHSYQAGRRWWNFSSVSHYCEVVNSGQAPLAGSESLNPEQLRLESLYLGFRTREGVALEVIQQQSGWQSVLAGLEQAGLVRLAHERVTATAQGLVVADRLPLRFVD